MGSFLSKDSYEENPQNSQIFHLENFSTIIDENGNKYIGELKDNKKYGYGILYYCNDEKYIRYEGFWKDDKKFSNGTMFYKNGSIYIGHWNNDLKEGEGIIYYDTGEKFVGKFKDDKKNGKGTFYSKNYNSIYLGLYKDDVKDGIGITYYKKSNKISKEEWNNGIIVSCKMEKNKNIFNYNDNSLYKSENKIFFNSPNNNNLKTPLPLAKYYKGGISNNFFDIMNFIIMTYDLLYDNGEIKEWKENNIIKLFERIGIEKNKYNDIILNNQINGTKFLKLTFTELKEYKINDAKDVKLIMKSVYFLREFYTKYFEYYTEYEREEEAKVPNFLRSSFKKISSNFKKSSSKVIIFLDKTKTLKTTPQLLFNKHDDDDKNIFKHKKGKSNNINDETNNYNNNNINNDDDEKNEDDINDNPEKPFQRKRNKSNTIKSQINNKKKEIIENVGFTLTKMSITKLLIQSLFQNGFNFYIPFNELTKGEEITEMNNIFQTFLGKWQGKKIIMKCLSIDKIQKDIKNNKNINKLNIRDIIQNFIKEINICNNLRHPNIVLFIGVSINKNEYYQIHEFVENNTLYNLLHKEKQIKSILKSVDNNKIYDNKNIIDDKSNNNEKTKKILNKNEISNNKLDNNLNNLNASINNIDINDDNEKEEINIKNNKTYENFHNLEEVSQGKILFQIAYEISIVLRYIHSRNIIHCNLRSDNILLDEEYHIKLGDFSLSKIVNFFSDNNKEEKYFLENKYEWTPPEILKNGKFEESSDIYSFGIILYELFTGEIPHKSIGDNEIIGLSKYLSNVNYRFLITLIKKCINEDPKNRPSLENISNFLYKASNLYDKREFIFEELANFILN